MIRWLVGLFKHTNPVVRHGTRGAVVAAALVATITGYEGTRTKAYLDIAGIPTICVGETRGVHLGDTATVDECKDRLRSRIPEFEAGLAKCIVNEDQLPDTTWVAVVSWTYNVGIGAACKSTLVKKLNKGDIVGACRELPKWNKAGGKVSKGLVARRVGEMKLCLEQRWL
jgi:lysozyme